MNPLLLALMAEAWAMEARHVQALLAELQTLVAGGKLETKAFFDLGGPRGGPKLEVDKGVARIPIHGVIMKSVHPIMKLFGFGGADLGEIRALLLDAVIRDDVKSIELDIDSPGGTVAGTKELADEVFSTRGLKPITARANGSMASAAYWIGSQADKVTATAGSVVGSIGIVGVIQDSSQAAANEGVKVHVVSSHPLKGAGTDGAPVTDAQLADMQRHVNTLAALFNADVVRGRGMSAERVAAVATGQVWVGVEAKAKGLVDEIEAAGTKQKEKSMELEKLKAELAAKMAECTGLTAEVLGLKAKIAELEALVKTAQATQRDMLLAKYETHVTPASLAAVKEYGDYCGADMAKFEAHLKSLPPATRSTRISDPGDSPSTVVQAELSPAALLVAKQMGNSAAELQKVAAKAS